MQSHVENEPALTGRIKASPSNIVVEHILKPQFDFELIHYLPYYIEIEKILTTQYEQMGLLTSEDKLQIHVLLDELNKEKLLACSEENMTDILFAIEHYVEKRLDHPVPAWHMDRSRNDVQATAQVMFMRDQLRHIVKACLHFAEVVLVLAQTYTEQPMPGYTHYQSAQVITVGFYFAALNEQWIKGTKRLQRLLDELNECPLGSGAMAGAELEWDRDEMATALGFKQPVRHALSGIASKEWMLLISGELTVISTTLSRFLTDVITWGSSEYQFIDLPDALSGISSAMPQKKNFPILERIRGKTAHMLAYFNDFNSAQRNTPYTNLVETAKEGGSHFYPMMKNMMDILTLSSLVMTHLSFHTERLNEHCRHGFFGGFSLANLLTATFHIPYRQAQVLSGKYIVQMIQQERDPLSVDVQTLTTLCSEQGYDIQIEAKQLRQMFEVEYNVWNKRTAGSTHPDEVNKMLLLQKEEIQAQYTLYENWIACWRR
ncbi:argininosuccinate lyase [Longirhabdus pacifica]|uniref:argininosuccinate lyase n=1 Tax=Longirhabdus pacifica TaxID=2305227 RepID=UPI001F0C91D6|nr:lyase family protein [Longirhabdus pacifica]